MRRQIHTTIDNNTYKKIKEQGKGQLNIGIENLMKMVETKKITIHIITEVIL